MVWTVIDGKAALLKYNSGTMARFWFWYPKHMLAGGFSYK